MKLTVETRGTGPDLVLLHGWGMNRRVWAPLVDLLERRFTLHLVDLPGHGNSPWEEKWSNLQAWAGAALEVAPERAAWAGWSLGGLVMLEAARLAPERITALAGIATTPCFVRRQDWPEAMDSTALDRFARELETDRLALLKRFLALQFQGAELRREGPRELARLLADSPAPHADALRVGLELLDGSDLRPVLARLEPPLLWVLGDHDRLVPPGLAKVLPCLAPGVRVRQIRGAGHASFLSHAGVVARHLIEALADD